MSARVPAFIAASQAVVPLRALLEAWESGVHAAPLQRATVLAALLARESGAESVVDETIGSLNAILLVLRQQLFGARLNAVADCAACGETMELELEVGTLLGNSPPAAVSGEFDVEADGQRARVRPPTVRDVGDALASGDAARFLLARCVEPQDGSNLTAALADAAGERMAELDPLADPELVLACPACNAVTAVPLDVAAFVWSEVDARARRILADVHSLARAYGWSEAEILSLSPARRTHYLELIGA